MNDIYTEEMIKKQCEGLPVCLGGYVDGRNAAYCTPNRMGPMRFTSDRKLVTCPQCIAKMARADKRKLRAAAPMLARYQEVMQSRREANPRVDVVVTSADIKSVREAA